MFQNPIVRPPRVVKSKNACSKCLRFSSYSGPIFAEQRGSTILFVLVGLAFAMAIVIGALNQVSTMSLGVFSVHTQSARAISIDQIEQTLRLEKSLEDSLDLSAGNANLKTCIREAALPPCFTNCCRGKNVKMDDFIYLSPYEVQINVDSRAKLVGPINAPVYYTKDAMPCDNATEPANCAYSVSGRFTARCPGDAAICPHAEHLLIELNVVPTGKFPYIKQSTRVIPYFVKANYQPSAAPITSQQTIKLGTNLNIDIIGNTGHPSEVQNLAFESCTISDASIVDFATGKCGDFVGNKATISLFAKSLGPPDTVTINYQIKDPGPTHNLSPLYSFTVKVIP
jgi:hypothetical protein